MTDKVTNGAKWYKGAKWCNGAKVTNVFQDWHLEWLPAHGVDDHAALLIVGDVVDLGVVAGVGANGAEVVRLRAGGDGMKLFFPPSQTTEIK